MALAGCAGSSASRVPASEASGASEASRSSAASATTTLDVFAASSLQATFTTIAKQFESSHPGTSVRLTFAGSADLVSQIEQGAPADVLATADQATMSKAADQVAGSAVPFATNTMTIVVPTGNPAGIKALADLASADVKTVICAPQVPCGAATAKIEQSSGVTIHAVSEENAVAGVLGKVTSGEADAGVAYVTDAAGATLSTIAIDPSVNVHTTYMIGALAGAGSSQTAAEFIESVRGPQGQQVLAQAGFGSA